MRSPNAGLGSGAECAPVRVVLHRGDFVGLGEGQLTDLDEALEHERLVRESGQAREPADADLAHDATGVVPLRIVLALAAADVSDVPERAQRFLGGEVAVALEFVHAVDRAHGVVDHGDVGHVAERDVDHAAEMRSLLCGDVRAKPLDASFCDVEDDLAVSLAELPADDDVRH